MKRDSIEDQERGNAVQGLENNLYSEQIKAHNLRNFRTQSVLYTDTDMDVMQQMQQRITGRYPQRNHKCSREIVEAQRRLKIQKSYRKVSRFRLAGMWEPHEWENDHEQVPSKWTEHLRALLCGTRDVESPLHLLRGYEDTILREIYSHSVKSWAAAVTLTPPANAIVCDPPNLIGGNLLRKQTNIGFCACGFIEFPKARGINVNMMPFIMGAKSSLPKKLQPYYDLAVAKCPVHEEELGTVCYITVSETYVRNGSTQRRGGLHIEAPGSVSSQSVFIPGWKSNRNGYPYRWGGGIVYADEPDELRGGLYMASNTDYSSQVFDALLDSVMAKPAMLGWSILDPILGEELKCLQISLSG